MQDNQWKTKSIGRIQELILEVDELMESSNRMPFTEIRLINEMHLHNLLSDIQEALPEEFDEVEKIMKDRQRIIADAKAEAQDLVEKARAYGERLVSEHLVLQQATEKAGQVLRQSQEESAELQRTSYLYAEDVFDRLEDSLERALQTIRQGKNNIRPTGYEGKSDMGNHEFVD